MHHHLPGREQEAFFQMRKKMKKFPDQKGECYFFNFYFLAAMTTIKVLNGMAAIVTTLHIILF
jgi:hypothetical protein